MKPLTPEQQLLVGELRAKEYQYQTLARAYERSMRFYINLGRFLDFLGIAVSLSLLYFRYLAAKTQPSNIESLLSWLALGLSVLFIIVALWRLIFGWSRHVETFPEIARAALEIYNLCQTACLLDDPTRASPEVILTFEKDKDFTAKLHPGPLRRHIRGAFQDTCRFYPNIKLQCYYCMRERTPRDFLRTWLYVPFYHCRQCGGSL
jgi:hypothetical protein